MIHSILPTYYNKMINKNVIKSTPKKGIMLTFDDGPNPLYTPKLLDLYKVYTFSYNLSTFLFLCLFNRNKNVDKLYEKV